MNRIMRMVLNVARAALVAAVVASCTGETTPAGPLGKAGNHLYNDLRPDVRIHVPQDLPHHREVIEVGEPPAKVAVQWRGWEHGGRRYLTELTFAVDEAADGVTLDAAAVGKPEERGTPAAPVEAQRFEVTWRRDGACSERRGSIGGYVLADGTMALDD